MTIMHLHQQKGILCTIYVGNYHLDVLKDSNVVGLP